MADLHEALLNQDPHGPVRSATRDLVPLHQRGLRRQAAGELSCPDLFPEQGGQLFVQRDWRVAVQGICHISQGR